MSRKRAQIDGAVADELNRNAEQAELKRRKKGLEVGSQTKSKPKAEQLKALKKLLAEGVQVETSVNLVNTCPVTRVTAINSQGYQGKKPSVVEAFELMTKGRLFASCFNSILGVFDLLASELTIQKPQSKQFFNSTDIDDVYTVRLFTTVKDWKHEELKDYWKEDNNSPYMMPIGKNAYAKLNSHIDGTTPTCNLTTNIAQIEQKMINILMANFRMLVSPNNVWNFDELIFPHLTLNDPLVAYLPRKPHSLGIVAYLGAVLLPNGLPFVVFVLPVTSDHGISGPHAFQSFLKSLKGLLPYLHELTKIRYYGKITCK